MDDNVITFIDPTEVPQRAVGIALRESVDAGEITLEAATKFATRANELANAMLSGKVIDKRMGLPAVIEDDNDGAELVIG